MPSEHARRCADSRRILDSGAGLLDLFSMLTFLLHSTTHRLLGVALLVVSSIQVEAVDVLGLSQWEGDILASQLSIIGLAERRSEAKTRPKPSGRSQT